MKTSQVNAKKLAALVKRFKPKASAEPPAMIEPMACLIQAFLQWNTTTKAATAALAKLTAALVDHNDLRVSHPSEIVAIIGPRYPQGIERAARLRDTLQEVFRREHATSLDALKDKPKKEVRSYIESLPGMVPYVAAYVALHAFGAHAIPADDRLTQLMVDEGILYPSTPPEQVSALLERQFKADESAAAHLAIQAWSDEDGSDVPTKPAPEKPAKKPAAPRDVPTPHVAEKSAGKTTKKTTKKTAKK
ncbi:MAG: hypothetical protein IT441_01660 [Phycisphaeraceae bacterium]|nr:hypothetical protein [Phycisphaeraceae bacterium]